MAINKGIVGIGDAGGAVVPDENFKALIYTGDGTTGRSIPTGLDADLVIIKNRSSAQQDWIWTDSVRGVSEYIRSNSTSQQFNAGSGQGVSAFGTGTVTIGDNNDGNLGVNGANGGQYSGTGAHVMYAFKGGGAAVSNTDGTNIISQVSANTAAGFSIVEYSGTNSVTDTVGHGLSETPEMVIVKNTSASKSWAVRHAVLASTQNIFLNATNAATTITATATGGVGVINSTTFGFAAGGTNASNVNISGNDFIAYAFHSVDGYSKIDSYTGTNGVGTNTIVTGFEPAFVMIKRTDSTGNWRVYDNARNPGAVPKEISANLALNSLGAEYNDPSAGNGYFFFSSTGFYFPSGYGNADINGTGDYIFMAFAE